MVILWFWNFQNIKHGLKKPFENKNKCVGNYDVSYAITYVPT